MKGNVITDLITIVASYLDLMNRIFLVLLIIAGCLDLAAQTRDQSFHTPVLYRNAEVRAVHEFGDGKLALAGRIDFYEDELVNGLILIDSDGSLVESFEFTYNVPTTIERMQVLANGNLIVSGRTYILEVNSTGAVTNEFYISGGIFDLLIQNDQKIVAVGDFDDDDFTNIVRLNSDFTLDNTFNQAISVDNTIRQIEVHQNKLLIAGNFTLVNGMSTNDVARLELDGTKDATFDSGDGTNEFITHIEVFSNDKIIVGPYVGQFDGYFEPSGVMSLNTDGSPDWTFNPSNEINSGSQDLARFGDDMLAIVFESYGSGGSAYVIHRLLPDGGKHPTFSPIQVTAGGIQDYIFPISDGFLVSERPLDGNPSGLTKYNASGVKESGFQVPIARYGTASKASKNGDEIVLMGNFFKVDDHETRNVVKLNSEGMVMSSFKVDYMSYFPNQLLLDNNGRVYFSTDLEFVRLQADGALDPTFTYTGPHQVRQIVQYKTDDLLIWTQGQTLYQINQDGSIDNSFTYAAIPSATSGGNMAFDVAPDNTIINNSLYFDGAVKSEIRRLLPDGSVDLSFDDVIGANGDVQDFKILGNGEIVLHGRFTEYQGISVSNMIKIDHNGNLVGDFTTSNWFPIRTEFVSWGNNVIIMGGNAATFDTMIEKWSVEGVKDETFSILQEETPYFGDVLMGDVGDMYLIGESSTDRSLSITKFQLANEQPMISDQVNLEITEDESLTISINMLSIIDPDDQSFTLTVLEGTNYALDGATITPHNNYVGELTVPVKVSDGDKESESFALSVTVSAVNDAPVITSYDGGQQFLEDQAIDFEVSDFSITDPDNTSDDFVLSILEGENYIVSGTSVLPAADFFGDISVEFVVSDGTAESEKFSVSLAVLSVNDVPVVSGYSGTLEVVEEGTLDVELASFEVTDPDHLFPGEFVLSLADGDNYNVTANAITPDVNYFGLIEVEATIKDEAGAAAKYLLTIDVTAVNDKPVVSGYKGTTAINQGERLSLALTDFEFTDVDSHTHTLQLLESQFYSLEGSDVIPDDAFSGSLPVSVQVSDGEDASEVFMFEITVNVVLGLEKANQLGLFPNPAKDHVIIQVDHGSYRMRVSDLHGKLIKEKWLVDGRNSVDISEWPSGIYILTLDDGVDSYRGRIIKQK